MSFARHQIVVFLGSFVITQYIEIGLYGTLRKAYSHRTNKFPVSDDKLPVLSSLHMPNFYRHFPRNSLCKRWKLDGSYAHSFFAYSFALSCNHFVVLRSHFIYNNIFLLYPECLPSQTIYCKRIFYRIAIAPNVADVI